MPEAQQQIANQQNADQKQQQEKEQQEQRQQEKKQQGHQEMAHTKCNRQQCKLQFVPALKPKQQEKEQKEMVHTKYNQKQYQQQFVPASKPIGRKGINKPNQRKRPPKRNNNNSIHNNNKNNNNQNKNNNNNNNNNNNAQQQTQKTNGNAAEVKRVPSYIRTEMEILSRLQQVNRNLRSLIKPRCQCDKTPRTHKCCKPARERRDQRKALAANQKGSKESAASAEANSAEQNATQTKAQSESALAKYHKCSCNKKYPAAEQPIESPRRGFQRFMQYMKPQRTKTIAMKHDKCICAKNRLAAEQAKAFDGTDQATEGVDGTKQATEAVDGKFIHRKCGHHRCKQHAPTAAKDSKEIVKPRRTRHRQMLTKKGAGAKDEKGAKAKQIGREEEKETADQVPEEEEELTPQQHLRDEKMFKQKTFGSYFKCFARKPLPTMQKEVDEVDHEPTEDEQQKYGEQEELEEQAAETKPKQKTAHDIVGERLKHCYKRLFGRRKRAPQHRPSVADSKLALVREYESRQSMHKLNKGAAHRDPLTTLLWFPNPANVHLKYVDNVKEYKARAAYKRRILQMEEEKRLRNKSPNDTPSSSSLEEYFQRLSARMVQEQREADARPPPPKPPAQKKSAKSKRFAPGPQQIHWHRQRLMAR